MSIFGFKKDNVLNLRVCGYLTRDAKAFDKVIVFSVCYGKDKYMDVKVWKSNEKVAALAECLEKHDIVAVDGIFDTYRKDDKEYQQIVADFITVQQEPPEDMGGEGGFTPASGAVGVSADDFEDAEESGELPF